MKSSSTFNCSKTLIKEKVTVAFLYLLIPFSSFFLSIFFYHRKWSIYLFALFGFYFGYTFIVPDFRLVDPTDSVFYLSEFIQYHNSPIAFSKLIEGFYSVETMQSDIYQPFVSWCVAYITDDSRVLFATFGFVFSLFLGKTLWLMFAYSKVKIQGFALVLLALFLVINPLWNINGVRMWTGLNVFLFGIVSYWLKNKLSGLFWIITSVFVHVSFAIPILFFLLFRFLRKVKLNYMFTLFLLSYIVMGMPSTVLNAVADFFPDFLKFKFDFYTDPNTVANFVKEKNESSFFILASHFSERIVPFLIVVYIFFYFRNNLAVKNNNLLFFNFILYNVIWMNIFSVIPSFGRFHSLFLLLSLFFLFVNINHLKSSPNFRYFTILLFPFFILIAIHRFREFLDFQSIFLFGGNFFINSCFETTSPLIQLL